MTVAERLKRIADKLEDPVAGPPLANRALYIIGGILAFVFWSIAMYEVIPSIDWFVYGKKVPPPENFLHTLFVRSLAGAALFTALSIWVLSNLVKSAELVPKQQHCFIHPKAIVTYTITTSSFLTLFFNTEFRQNAEQRLGEALAANPTADLKPLQEPLGITVVSVQYTTQPPAREKKKGIHISFDDEGGV